ncbi:MAG: TolC family protein [Verrucomicrobia bacterium]|nr:TolC family protein [Verrucomicrobiota bacterium]
MKLLLLLLLVSLPGWIRASGIPEIKLSLREAEERALCCNENVLRVGELLLRAQEGRLEEVGRWYPSVDYHSWNYATSNVSPITKTHSAFMSQFVLTQALLSTDRYYGVRIANLVVQQLRLLLDAAVIDALFEVRTLYYKVLFDFSQVDTYLERIKLLEFLAQQEEADYAIGTNILLNVNQSLVAIANAKAAYFEAMRVLRVDIDALARVIGYLPGCVDLELVDTAIPSPCSLDEVGIFSEGEICCWEQQALRYRPELRTKKNEWSLASEEVKRQRGTYLPEINFIINYGGAPADLGNIPSSSFTNQHFDLGVGVEAKWLLFDGFSREHRIRGAAHFRNAASHAYRQSVQMTYEAVRAQVYAIEEALASLNSAEANVCLAQETLMLAENQLKIGYITVFNYQSVVDGWIEALNIRNRSRFEYVRGFYGLRHAAGVDLANYGSEDEQTSSLCFSGNRDCSCRGNTSLGVHSEGGDRLDQRCTNRSLHKRSKLQRDRASDRSFCSRRRLRRERAVNCSSAQRCDPLRTSASTGTSETARTAGDGVCGGKSEGRRRLHARVARDRRRGDLSPNLRSQPKGS